MTTTEAILCGIEQGGTLDELANELGMRKSMLMARIEFLVRAGYLCELNGEGCAGCPMGETCGVSGECASVKRYALTEKGAKLVKAAKKNEFWYLFTFLRELL